MNDTDQIAGLEAALVERAEQLATEYLAHGREEHTRMLAETRQRLLLAEEHQSFAAKGQAERAYQQQVQAAELQLRAELDRLRMSLVNSVLGHLPARLEQLAENETRYLPLLRAWLREGVQAIERNELTVQVNARDLQRLQKGWEHYAREVAPDKKLQLSPQTLESLGGVLVSSGDGNIRFDNTFEGRMERLGESLQGAVARELMPEVQEVRGG